MPLFVKEKPFYRWFFSLTLMIAFQNLIVFSVNLADNIMLGAYHETSLSGVALVNQIQFLLQMIIMGVGEGMIVLAAQYWGRNDTAAIRRITAIGMRVGLAAALLLWAAVFFFPRQCLSLLSNDNAILDEGVRYLKIICFSYPLFAVTNILLASLRSVETVRIGFIVSASTLVINVFLNALLIFGNLGMPRLGVRGAAIATLTARAVEVAIVLLYVFRLDNKLRLRLSDLFQRLGRGAGHLVRDYVKTGSPVIVSNALWGVAMAVQTAILGRLGQPVIAANSIATTVFQVLTVVSYGAASASSIIIGKSIGEGKSEQIKQYTVTMQILFLLIGLFTGTGLFLFRDFILNFYSVTEQTRVIAMQFMGILSVTVCGTTYQVSVLTGIVRGGGDTRFVLFNDMLFMWGLVIPSAALSAFVFHFPPTAVFICLKIDQLLKCIVAAIKVNRYHWIKQLTR